MDIGSNIDVMGQLKLWIEVRASDMAAWPVERIRAFFSHLAAATAVAREWPPPDDGPPPEAMR